MSGPAISQLLAEVFERLDYWDDGFVDGLVTPQLHVDVLSIEIRIEPLIQNTHVWVLKGWETKRKSYERGIGWFWQ